jgi:hypothetical protein
VRFTLICAFVMFLAALASARILSVPSDYATIQAGIDASINGDTVLVAPGEYAGNIQFNGQEIVLTSSNGPDMTTILGHIVISGYSDTASCIIQGFTQNGQDHDPVYGLPGIRINSGRPIIVGNIISQNIWQCCGGIMVSSQSAVIRHNIIKDNWAIGEGGGIGIPGASNNVEISYNIITHNGTGLVFQEAGIGGGISSRGGVRIFYNLIYDNTSQCYSYPNSGCAMGGGIFIYNPPCQIYNNTIVKNYVHRTSPNPPYVGGEGSGLYILWNSADSLVLENNIISFNRRGGLDLMVSPGSPVVEGYNLVFGNAIYDFNASETSLTDVFSNPLFVDTTQNDFRLQSGSPCIDAGNPEYPHDPDSTRIDIGALFFDHSVNIDDNDAEYLIDFQLHQNYPNPFNAQTTISYFLPQHSIDNLRIFDITGRVVNKIVDECQEAGKYLYIWDGKDEKNNPVATSIYFYELNVGEEKQIKSMIMIR